MEKKKSLLKEKFSSITIITLIILILYCVTFIVLLCWAVFATFKTGWDLEKNVLGLPRPFVWNYSTIFKHFIVPIDNDLQVGFIGLIFNSIAYCIGCTLSSAIVTCVTSYLCARFKFKFSEIVYTIVIVTMILPIVGNTPSVLYVTQKLGIYDTVFGTWLMSASFLGMNFLIFYNVFKSIPMTYTEAAEIDGANNFQVMLLVIMPLVKTLFFTICLINFIGFWNDYQTPLMYMPNHPTLSYGVYLMSRSSIKELSEGPMRLGSAVIMLIPILVIFLLLHKRLLGNLTVGGLKG